MSKTERQILLKSTKGVNVTIDPDTHKAIKMWAQGEGITLVQAIRIMAKFFFINYYRKMREEKTDSLLRKKRIELVNAIRQAKKKQRD